MKIIGQNKTLSMLIKSLLPSILIIIVFMLLHVIFKIEVFSILTMISFILFVIMLIVIYFVTYHDNNKKYSNFLSELEYDKLYDFINMSGAELIMAKRDDQIEKHGYTAKYDYDKHKNNELINTATMALDSLSYYPKDKELNNINKIDQLSTIGSLMAAEIDRLKYEESLHINKN